MSDATFLADLRELFDRTVLVEVYKDQTIAGKPNYEYPFDILAFQVDAFQDDVPATSYPARIVMKNVGVRSPNGTIIVGRGTIYFPQIVDIQIRDRITLPAGYPGPTQPPILSISTVDDELAGSYTAVVIG